MCVCAFLPVDCNKQKRKWHGDEVLIEICQPLGFHSSCDSGQAFSWNPHLLFFSFGDTCILYLSLTPDGHYHGIEFLAVIYFPYMVSKLV